MEKLRHEDVDCLAQGCAASLTGGGGVWDWVCAQPAESKAHPLFGTSGCLVPGCELPASQRCVAGVASQFWL